MRAAVSLVAHARFFVCTRLQLYHTVEHFYQSQKFAESDPKRAAEIRAARTPYAAKKLAQDGFNADAWAAAKEGVMRRGLYAKFTQHPALQERLLMTGSAVLIEASTKDPYWGGLLAGSANRLGVLLMQLRGELQSRRATASVLVHMPHMDNASLAHGASADPANAFHDDLARAQFLAEQRYEEAVLRQSGRRAVSRQLLGLHAASVRGVERKSDIGERAALISSVPPFTYLSATDVAVLAAASTFRMYEADDIIMVPRESGDSGDVYVMVEGDAYTTDHQGKEFLETLVRSTVFGLFHPLFGQRYAHAIASGRCLVLAIAGSAFMQVLRPGSLYALALARNLMVKHDIFGHLAAFRTLVLDGVRSGSIPIDEMLARYKRMNSALHTHANDPHVLDLAAWSYAVQRLPECVTATYVWLICATLPDLYAHPELALPISSALRARAVFKLNEGKGLVVMRELETDLLDFCANLAIHIIESNKLRRRLGTPKIMGELMKSLREGETADIQERFLAQTPLSVEERAEVLKLFPRKRLLATLLDCILHHSDYSLIIDIPRKLNASDPSERWTRTLGEQVKLMLGLDQTASIAGGDVPHLVVDLMQGSTRTAISCLSPWLHANAAKIMAWGAENNVKLVTRTFASEADRLYAMSFYYLKAHPAAVEERRIFEAERGIVRITETEMTGIQVLLFDVNRLDPALCDPAFRVRPASEAHLIVCIGYTFGSQSADIMRCLVMLFGHHIRSVNIFGKAGGLCGRRGVRCNLLCATSRWSAS